MTGVRRKSAIEFRSRPCILYFKLSDSGKARTIAATARAKLCNRMAWHDDRGHRQQWTRRRLGAVAMLPSRLRSYGEETLAGTIAQRWVAKKVEVYPGTGKLVEKYDVTGSAAAAAAKSAADGSLDHGVLRRLLAIYPRRPARILPQERAQCGNPALDSAGSICISV